MKLEIETLPGIIKVEEGLRTKYFCSVDEFESICFYLKSHAGYIWFIDIIAIDKKSELGHIELRYLFNLVESNEQIFLVVEVPKKTDMRSIAHLWASAGLCEHELYELFGVKFNRAYGANYFSESNTIYPLLKDELRSPHPKENKDYERVKSLQNPFLRNQTYFSYDEKENLVSKCKVNGGSYHIGLEKILENLPLKKAFLFLENYFAYSGSNWSFLLSHNAEVQNNIEIPARAQALRMVTLEFNRVLEHLFYFRDLCFYFESNRYVKQSLIWIKRVQSLMLSATGNEFMSNLIRVGGINGDVNQGWLSRVILELGDLENEIQKVYSFITSSIEWTENLNVKLLSKSEANTFSLTGPIARAAGLNLDNRKINPFYYYQDIEFEVPVGTNGTSLDLFCVKMEELFQSFNIIIQVLDNLPTGRCLNKQFIEFDLMKKVDQIPDEQLYRDEVTNLYNMNDFDGSQLIEGSNGLLGLTTLYQNNKINRIKLFSNDLYLKGLFEQSVKMRDRNFIELIWTSLTIDMKTVER